MSVCGSIGSRSGQRVFLAASVLLSFGLHSTVALTQSSSDPMEICSSKTDSTARLTCFDDEMRKRHAAKVPAAVASSPNVTTARTKPADDTVGLDGAQLIRKRKAENIHADAPEPMVVTLARLVQRPGHQYSFELDNGQVWESTDVAGDLFLGPHESVTIRPGVLGAFFLKTQSGVSIRVHRLR